MKQTILILLVLLSACSKKTDFGKTTTTTAPAILLNPDKCQAVNIYTTQSGPRLLSSTSFFSGEVLDSQWFYDTNGKHYLTAIHSNYNGMAQETRSYDINHAYTGLVRIWRDANSRVTRQQGENASGSVIYDYTWEYQCK